MIIFSKLAMILSLTYYMLTLGYLWAGQLIGFHNEIWEAYDFPVQAGSPPIWALLVGLAVAAFALGCLAWAYCGAWAVLNGGRDQDFRDLSRYLYRLGWGLIGFWLGYNLLTGAVQHVVVVGLVSTEGFDFGWDPLDLDIIIAIVGVVLLAIAQTLERAWLAEEENRQFL